MKDATAEVGIYPQGVVSEAPLRIYTGLRGQIGDLVAFTATARRIKELFPHSQLTFAVIQRYAGVGELLQGPPDIDRLFVTQLHFERLTPPLFQPWERGWPVDLRGDNEVAEQRRHDLVLESRPRHTTPRWWERRHLVEELAVEVGVTGLIDWTTDIRLPDSATPPPGAAGKIVLHSDPATDAVRAWPWEHLQACVRPRNPDDLAYMGRLCPKVLGATEWLGKTMLVEMAAILAPYRSYVGIDSGPMWLAARVQVPVISLYGALQTCNPRTAYREPDGPLAMIPPDALNGWTEHVLRAIQISPTAALQRLWLAPRFVALDLVLRCVPAGEGSEAFCCRSRGENWLFSPPGASVPWLSHLRHLREVAESAIGQQAGSDQLVGSLRPTGAHSGGEVKMLAPRRQQLAPSERLRSREVIH